MLRLVTWCSVSKKPLNRFSNYEQTFRDLKQLICKITAQVPLLTSLVAVVHEHRRLLTVKYDKLNS